MYTMNENGIYINTNSATRKPDTDVQTVQTAETVQNVQAIQGMDVQALTALLTALLTSGNVQTGQNVQNSQTATRPTARVKRPDCLDGLTFWHHSYVGKRGKTKGQTINTVYAWHNGKEATPDRKKRTNGMKRLFGDNLAVYSAKSGIGAYVLYGSAVKKLMSYGVNILDNEPTAHKVFIAQHGGFSDVTNTI